MKKLSITLTTLTLLFGAVSPVFAQSAEITQVVNFITNTNKLLLIVAGALAGLFIILGSITYITSSGNPENLEKGKKTVIFSLVGLILAFGASLIVAIVTQLATASFST